MLHTEYKVSIPSCPWKIKADDCNQQRSTVFLFVNKAWKVSFGFSESFSKSKIAYGPWVCLVKTPHCHCGDAGSEALMDRCAFWHNIGVVFPKFQYSYWFKDIMHGWRELDIPRTLRTFGLWVRLPRYALDKHLTLSYTSGVSSTQWFSRSWSTSFKPP